MQNRGTNFVLSSRTEQEAEDQTGEDSSMSQTQFPDHSDSWRSVWRRDPRYYPAEHADPRMDTPRDHVHQLHRRSISEDAKELDLAADYI